MNEQIYNWLRSFPGLELLQWQQVDAVPGGCGLFFRGATANHRNLLGQTQNTLRYRLCRYGDGEESAVFFLLLGAWAEQDGTATLKNARCTRDEGGLALWEADLEVQT